MALGMIDTKKFHESQFKLGKAQEKLEYMKETKSVLYKIMLYVFGLIAASIIGWGTWVTVCAFDMENVRKCAYTNQEQIELVEAKIMSDLDDKILRQEMARKEQRERFQKQLDNRMDEQKKILDKHDNKLEKIYDILLEIKRGGQ